jgi:NMD protein affecting ribosome stability and mRNA decay
MKSSFTPQNSFHPGRHLQLLDERQDPYHDYFAVEGEAQCSSCGAVYKDERWQWTEPSIDAATIRCPACRRMAEQSPAAYLEIEAPIPAGRHDELINSIREIERLEKSADPMQRIMSIEETGKQLLVTTTSVRLARSIAQLLQSSYGCDLDFHFDRNTSLLWLRCRTADENLTDGEEDKHG